MDQRWCYHTVVLLSLFCTFYAPIVRCGELPYTSKKTEFIQTTKDSSAFLTKRGEFKWSVAILRNDRLYGKPIKIFLCGGALRDNGTVLTSAECVRHQPKASLSVQFGRWDLGERKEEDNEVLEVETIVPHPGYKSSSKQHNIALLFLKDTVSIGPSVNVTCIADREMRNVANQRCYTVGWNAEFSNGTNKLLMLPVDSPNRAECQESIRRLTRLPKFLLSPNDVCAFAVDTMDENYPCARVTGSGLVCGNADQFCLVGLSSYSLRSCSRVSVHDVFVDVRQYTEWIDENVRKHRPQ